MSLTRELRFLDSFRFLPSALNTLASNLPKNKPLNLKKYFPDDNEFKQVCKKGHYPYDWMDDIDKFDEKNFHQKKISTID